ncbi:hypothetical protein [Natrinema sp. DC36]|uniref:hypothetical protein n=1 Tax=Natrinema sp. DC36 TaxID=2878680 RepID=UPI001CF0B206|nr:hypothetical protein [Natrinema sp. DC36]
MMHAEEEIKQESVEQMEMVAEVLEESAPSLAQACYTLYEEFMEAGFSKKQATMLVAEMEAMELE